MPDEHSLILILLCLDLGWNTHSGVYSRNILGVWISDETLHLMYVCYINSRCLDIRWNTPSWNFKFFSVFGYQIKHPFSCLLYYFSVFGYQIKKPFSLYYFFGVWISDKTALLVFVILLFSVWISDETLILVFVILHLGVWISDKTPLLVFVILLCGYRCLKIRWNTFLGAWISRV